jgi:dTDP-4-amino-4,6-dideoxygalactose transaminase
MNPLDKLIISVPFNDLHAQYLSIKPEIDAAIAEVIKTSAFIRGPFVEKFEEQFAQMAQIKYCVSCANGTDALYIAMRALGVKPDDEVIVPAHSWISSSETVSQAGGKVVFCDTQIDSFTIDPAQIESKITSRTVGIIPVHLFGQSADMHPIMEIAKKNNLWVLEDCAQSHLASYKGRQVGTFGNAASFSFYPGKNLGAFGDAGAITTNDLGLANRMRMISRHGGLTKGEHTVEGINSRLDGIQAAVLSVKLPHLLNWTRQRQNHAQRYSRMLSGLMTVTPPKVGEDREHVWHLYVIKNEKRDSLMHHLSSRGIQTIINYPMALPFLPAYQHFGHLPTDFPNAFHNQYQILSLPIFPEITDSQIDRVVAEIEYFFKTAP